MPASTPRPRSRVLRPGDLIKRPVVRWLGLRCLRMCWRGGRGQRQTTTQTRTHEWPHLWPHLWDVLAVGGQKATRSPARWKMARPSLLQCIACGRPRRPIPSVRKVSRIEAQAHVCSAPSAVAPEVGDRLQGLARATKMFGCRTISGERTGKRPTHTQTAATHEAMLPGSRHPSHNGSRLVVSVCRP